MKIFKKVIIVHIPKSYTGQRLDRALHMLIPELSRTQIKRISLNGEILREKHAICDPASAVKAGETYHVVLPPVAESKLLGEAIALNVIYEDDDIVVINKPAGLVVHPAPGHSKGTLVHALLHHCGKSLSGINSVKRPGIVHRLDKDTSGLMVVAKNDKAHHALAKQFSKHSIDRVYLAIVRGIPLPLSGEIKTFIARHPHHRQKMAVSKTRGKKAITNYEVKEVFRVKGQSVAAVVRCQLKTGRTHQVRVHMAHIGHPIIGDQVYGRCNVLKTLKGSSLASMIGSFSRQALHAELLAFDHPSTGRRLTLTTPPPADIKNLQRALKTTKNGTT